MSAGSASCGSLSRELDIIKQLHGHDTFVILPLRAARQQPSGQSSGPPSTTSTHSLVGAVLLIGNSDSSSSFRHHVSNTLHSYQHTEVSEGSRGPISSSSSVAAAMQAPTAASGDAAASPEDFLGCASVIVNAVFASEFGRDMGDVLGLARSIRVRRSVL